MTTFDRADQLDRRIADALEEIAAPRLPEYLDDTLQRTARLAQRTSLPIRRFPAMNRFWLAASAAVLVAVVVGGGLILSHATTPSVGASPTPPASRPSSSGGPSSSTESGLPSELVGIWLGETRPILGSGAQAGAKLVLGANSMAMFQSNDIGNPVLRASASMTGDGLLLESSGGGPGGCAVGNAGTYSVTLSQSGQTLTIGDRTDPCLDRRTSVPGTWWRVDCRHPSNPCLGDIDPGNYGSEYFASSGAHGVPWVPKYGALTYTVPQGWSNGGDFPSDFRLAPAADYAAAATDSVPAAEIEVISNALAESQKTPCSGQPDASVASGASAFVAWLRTVPGLDVSATSRLTIDGHPALSVDLTGSRAPSACDGGDAVIEYLMTTGWFSPGSGSTDTHHHAIGVGNRDRLILLDVPSGYLVAIVLSVNDPSRLDSFAAQAMPIVQSFKFTDAFPRG